MAVLHINGSTEEAHIFRNVVTEDDRPHRRLAGATLAHEQDLALLLAHIHHGRRIGRRTGQKGLVYDGAGLGYRAILRNGQQCAKGRGSRRD